ncbi:hypothetical protein EV356DRAFT_442371 [Viridothelium virens]|uniref:Mitochondrial fission process protein 1 n=1 Tax=Viridothelium virens TaxID=1048519 RepID=A0A6A6HHI6_VIRVR|nr:hypothetical protein EV356DRAFT_442371 [Viridothelium virens]
MAGADDEGARQRRASTEESKEPPVPAPKRLPKSIQDSLDNEEKLWEVMYEGKSGDSTDSSLRYAAYASRLRTILLSAHRYVAYTSDIGESFRPVAHPRLVRGAYAISWLYLGGDVMHEGYKAYLRNQRVLHPESQHDSPEITSSDKHAADRPAQTSLGSGLTGSSVGSLQPHRVVPLEDYRSVMAQRAVFQSLASMGLPAFTIHSIVRYSGRALKNSANKTLRTYGPIGLGLAAVPFLPFVFDKPVEEAVEWTFYTAFKAIGGPGAVGERPVFGRKDLRHQEAREGAEKEKEL